MSRLHDENLELPVEIIQHIQSFMEIKPAAQSSLLSKSWYNAWSTRPLLCFRYLYFRYETTLWDFVTKTVERYINLNVKVDKLIVKVYSKSDVALVTKLISDDAVNLRVNVLDFSFNSFRPLPTRVFANKNLTELYLARCEVNHLIPGNVLCSNLRSLSLHDVFIDDSTFKDILVRCTNIERLTLNGYMPGGLSRINASELHNLKILIAESEALWYSGGITSSVICGRFLNVTYVVLKGVIVDDSFLTNLSSSFPNLEDLTLENLRDDQNLIISSRSIKHLSLKQYSTWLKMANFDVPSIRMFKFTGSFIPDLSFTDSSKEWKSEIIVSGYSELDLSKLGDLLMKLGHSKISLHLDVGNWNVALGNIENFRSPAVEELTYYVGRDSTANNVIMACLLSCRPKLVSFIYCLDTKAILFLYKKLIEQMNQKGFNNSTQDSSFFVNDLKEVKVELFEESLKEWQPIKASLDDFDISNHGAERLRFKLKWGSPYRRARANQYQIL